MSSSLEILKKMALTPFVCLMLSLAGCKTMKSGQEVQKNTSTLKAVSDSQYILRLAPYTSEDSSAFVFEVCQISSPNDGCTIAFLSSARQPVIFTVREIKQHRQSAAEALAKFVKDNAELAGAVGSAGGAGVAYQVGMKMKDPTYSPLGMKAQVMEMIKDQGFSSFGQAQEVIAARKRLLSEQLGIEIDRIEFWDEGDGLEVMRIQKPAKLEAHLWSQGLYPYASHVYKQDFLDFFANRYATELAANGKTVERVLDNLPMFLGVKNDLVSENPRIDIAELIKEYRNQLHGRPLLDADMKYQRIIEDLIDPSLAEEFKKFSNLQQVAKDIYDLSTDRRDILQEFFDRGFPGLDDINKYGMSRYRDARNLESRAVGHLESFSVYRVWDTIPPI